MPGSFLSDVKGFTPVIDALAAELGLIPAVVYGVAWRFCQMRDGVCHASLDTISKRVGISRRTVRRHIHALCDAGYLEDLTPNRNGLPHRYRDTGKVQIIGMVAAKTGRTESPTPESVPRTESPSTPDIESEVPRTESPTRIPSEETIQESSTKPDRKRLAKLMSEASVIVSSFQSPHYFALLEDYGIETIALAFAEAKKNGNAPRHQYLRAILKQSEARGCKPGEWTPEKQEPAGKPYARDGPLRTILVEDSQGNITQETIG